MDLISILTGLFIGFVLAYLIILLVHKTKHVSKAEYNVLSDEFQTINTQLKISEDRLSFQEKAYTNLLQKSETAQQEIKILENNCSVQETMLKNKTEKISELNKEHDELVKRNVLLQDEQDILKQKIAELAANYTAVSSNLNAQKEINQQQEEQLRQLNADNKKLHATNSTLSANNTALNDKLETQKAEITEIQHTAHLRFEQIAHRIFEDKSGKFTAANKANIEALLKPLGENIDLFKKKVEETYDKESKERFSLEQKVKELVEQTNKVSNEANNLATALKGQSKKQGNWGEVILESILQKSGLVKDREYFLQQTIKDESGRSLRPDVLIKLPDNRTIIIDSKVSLVAYDRFSAADHSEQQALYLTEHLKSVYTHIDDLSSKKYDNLEASLDFTMMFVPIEPAYLVSIQGDQDLWAYAYAKRILLVSPTNLIACLKLMADLWKREIQSKNAMEIVKRGELLYEKFVTFVSTLEEVGHQINKAQLSYNAAIGQLSSGSGHLIGQAIKLKNLGLKSSKEIPASLLPPDFEPEHST